MTATRRTKPIKRTTPPGLRWKCLDCGGEYVNGRDDERILAHAARTGFRHTAARPARHRRLRAAA